MFNALLILFENWIGVWSLSVRKEWDAAESRSGSPRRSFNISLRPKDDGPIDMNAFFQRQRPLIFTSFLALAATNMFQNWWDRALIPGAYLWL